MIELTGAAVKQIRRVLEDNNKLDGGIRFSIDGGGCSGLKYKFEIIDQAQEKDHVVEQDGVKIFIDPKSGLYLQGMQVDWHADIMGANFVFNNPNAKQSCGCGTSFSV